MKNGFSGRAEVELVRAPSPCRDVSASSEGARKHCVPGRPMAAIPLPNADLPLLGPDTVSGSNASVTTVTSGGANRSRRLPGVI